MFGENLRAARNKHGYTQQEFATMIGIAQPTLAQYETHAKSPTVAVADRMAQLLGTTVDELLHGIKEEKENE